MDDPPQSRAAYFRGVAEMLRGLAAERPYDVHRCDQLSALADGFERFATRLEKEMLTRTLFSPAYPNSIGSTSRKPAF